MDNTSIVICGEKYNIGTRVVLWNEKNGLNGYDMSKYSTENQDRKTGKDVVTTVKGKRYSQRSVIKKVDRNWVNKYVTQFFLHHSGLYHSADTYDVLHKQRGLSVHFILDDDGTLYQTLDVREKAWHGGGCNKTSVGIEIDSRASVTKCPNAYDQAHQKKYRVGPRKIIVDNIHGVNIRGYDYSDGQYNALIKLGKVLCDQLDIPKDFPRSNGKIIKGIIKDFSKYKGIMCHYNITENKIDPISLDYDRFLKGIGGNTNVIQNIFNDTIDLRDWMGRQEGLLELGYHPGPIDGICGKTTKDALKSFQQSVSLNVTGEWDEITKVTMMTILSGHGIIVKI